MSRCPPPVGEFPPDGCGLITGSISWADGRAARNLPVGVDTTLAERRFWLVERGQATDARGRFSLVVSVVAPLGSRPDLSPVTVDLVVLGNGPPGPAGPWRNLVRVTFALAKLGAPVVPAFVLVQLPW